ncbi:putative pacifastin-related serine protease inhibitor [Operophtera brumata]|uniref:Putative pacifastin-related serine protease inhibitor n=1 Tax=Operophtera brumata TaxID=104452 RepID=A0A0L7KVM2_OPEBR|nr:putative pacifastin-related serine protease inhibitor [Operophtera brumata]
MPMTLITYDYASAYIIVIGFLPRFNVNRVSVRPGEPCVPTATILGPCHVCICSTDGIYHCREKICQEIEIPDPNLLTCEPNQLYRQDTTFCSCTALGHWQSTDCKEKFHRLVLQEDPMKKHLKTNITCAPGSLYITDCNVCLCRYNRLINFDSCTTRACPKRFKGEVCNPGEVYRSANEFCVCNTINHYTDHFCLNVLDDAVQIVQAEYLAGIIDVGRNESSIVENTCKDDMTYTMDCNKCTCLNKKYACTKTPCLNKTAGLRVGKLRMSMMPELKSDDETCVPGKRYKFKCNTCTCNGKKQPVCTSMLCLEDIIVDATVLKRSIVSY